VSFLEVGDTLGAYGALWCSGHVPASRVAELWGEDGEQPERQAPALYFGALEPVTRSRCSPQIQPSGEATRPSMDPGGAGALWQGHHAGPPHRPASVRI
jgi:hypothetical protein